MDAPISPTWTRSEQVVPLGNGRGIAVVASDDNRSEQIWLQPLEPQSISQKRDCSLTTQTTSDSAVSERERLVRPSQQQPEWRPPVQTGGFLTGKRKERADLSQRETTPSKSTCALPDQWSCFREAGGWSCPPTTASICNPRSTTGGTIQSLTRKSRTGRLLRSIRARPIDPPLAGLPALDRTHPSRNRSPSTLAGEEAVLGVACDGKGERIWAVIGTWTGDWAQHTILLMDSEGNAKRQ